MRSRTPEKPRECPNCGTVVASTDRLCWHCYRSLPPPPRPKPEPVQRRRRRRLPTSTIVAIAVILVLGGYYWHVRSSPTTALMAYLRAEQVGDVKTAYRLLSVRSREMIKPEDMAKQAPRADSSPIYVVRDVEPQNGGARITLDVTVEGGDGVAPSQQRAAMYMVREQGRWRVDMVRTCQAQVGNVMIGEHGWFRFWSTGPGRR